MLTTDADAVATLAPLLPAAACSPWATSICTPLGPAEVAASTTSVRPLGAVAVTPPFLAANSANSRLFGAAVVTVGAPIEVDAALSCQALAATGAVGSTPLKARIAPRLRPLPLKLQVKLLPTSAAVATL